MHALDAAPDVVRGIDIAADVHAFLDLVNSGPRVATSTRSHQYVVRLYDAKHELVVRDVLVRAFENYEKVRRSYVSPAHSAVGA